MSRRVVRAAWLGDERGSMLPLFAIVVVAVIGLVGAAIDYGRAFSVRSALQNTVDGAVMAAASASEDGSDLSAAAQNHFDKSWSKRHNSGTAALTASKDGEDTITAVAQLTLPTTFLNVLGIGSVELRAQAGVKIGMGKAEIVMVLDNTGSMTGAKLSDLKTAATSLVDTIYAQKNADKNVKVSLVPFSSHVNVGIERRNEPWMEVPLDYSETKNVCGYQSPILSKTNCRMETVTYTVDGQPQTGEREVCDYTYGPEEYVCNDYTYTYTWNGCAGSRSYPLNVQDGSYGTRIPGIMNASCPSPVMPLDNKPDQAKTAIDGMLATGNTYIPAGLIWGWRMLSPQVPFDEGADPATVPASEKPRKILILMSDGENTLSPNGSNHTGNDVILANQYTTELCNNIKAADIEVYTVAFDVTNPDIKAILEGCASGPPYYYDAANGTELVEAFKSVAKSLVAMRLAK
jgi:Flp pilus assembly protein TadG